MQTLREYLQAYTAAKQALGHFNVADTHQFNAVVAAARVLVLPVIVGVSEKELAHIGLHNIVALVHAARAQGLPVFLNLDHAHDPDIIRRAIVAGFDSVMFDGSRLPWEENVARTKEIVSFARSQKQPVLVEAEIGFIGSGSSLRDALPEGMSALTKPEEAAAFVRETGVDLLAPAVGTLHGMLKSQPHPQLDHERIAAIARAVAPVHVVLHGGSGTADEDFARAIAAGISIVHVSTEIRRAYRQALEKTLQQHPEELAPYRLFAPAEEAVRAVVKRRMELFANSAKIEGEVMS